MSCGDPKYLPKAKGGFNRGSSCVQTWVEAGGPFPPAGEGRYHLFVNYMCGWCHRVLLMRSLKGLMNCIPVSQISVLGSSSTDKSRGWSICEDHTGNGFTCLYELYNSNNPEYGSVQLTIPVLFDTVEKRVVSNDSAQICIMLNSAFNEFAERPDLDLYPARLQDEIEAMNDVLYPGINDGVYRCKFAQTDEAYDEAFVALMKALEFLQTKLEGGGQYLCGDTITFADVRAFPHLFRFDGVYSDLMVRPSSGSVRLASKSPAVVSYLQRMFEMPEVQRTCDLHLATLGYYWVIGGMRSLEELDAIYEKERLPWMPKQAELEAKRTGEGIVM